MQLKEEKERSAAKNRAWTKWKDRAPLVIAVLVIVGAVVYEIIQNHTDFKARTQPPDAILSSFVATDTRSPRSTPNAASGGSSSSRSREE